jgi:hypothetical protein
MRFAMNETGRAAAAVIAGLLVIAAAHARPGPAIITSDVDRFYRLYDQAGGAPSGEVLQHDYIDAGTPGVREFVPYRILSGEKLAQEVRREPDVYRNARTCLAALPAVRKRLAPAFAKLAKLYPEARFPPVTILIGGNNSGGTSGPSGVLVGLEVVCRTRRANETIEDRFVHLIAHEYGHVEQEYAPAEPSVLRQSLVEGDGELIAELTTGAISNTQILPWTRGREVEIGQRFLVDAHNKDYSNWLYNGEGDAQHPGDLGYWVGYRIARRYYVTARDKRQALKDLLTFKDPDAILAKSGWRPGL